MSQAVTPCHVRSVSLLAGANNRSHADANDGFDQSSSFLIECRKKHADLAKGILSISYTGVRMKDENAQYILSNEAKHALCKSTI
jgi:hypothetical protein